MKGVVFTEFMDMVEEKFSAELLDQIIAASDLPNDGAYTAVGTYDHREIVRLVQALGERTGVSVPDLLRTFGGHLLTRFATGYPQFFTGVPGVFDFLASIDRHIHVEVRKLYPDAELPRFEHERPDDATMHLDYWSVRGMADLAEGLIQGSVEHFGEPMSIERSDQSGGKGTLVRFTLRRKTP